MVTTGRRTTIRPGRELDYDRVHASIPEPVAAALRRAGVLRWSIWRDGSRLFHAIDTVDGYPAMLARLSTYGPLDPEWDELIAALLEPGDEYDVILPAVWTMDGSSQYVPAPEHP
jgi:L-rhamnose mutarotase